MKTIETHILSIDEIRLKTETNGDKLLSDKYEGCRLKLNFRCRNKHNFKQSWADYNGGHRCQICSKNKRKFENEIFNMMLYSFPDAEQNIKGLLKNKRFELDIWIPSLKKAIELDGDNWHNRPEAMERDIRKNKECQEAGISLLRIKYSEFKKLKKDNNLMELYNRITEFLLYRHEE